MITKIKSFMVCFGKPAKDFALGATYLLFKHLHVQVEMQRMKYFTGGLTYKIHLK